MGSNMAARLLEKGHDVVATDTDPEAVEQVIVAGAVGAKDVVALVNELEPPRVIWLMVPHAAVDDVIDTLLPHVTDGDILIDGGNSRFTESIKRYEQLADRNIHFLDVGVSGGPDGARNGACMMIGGDQEIFEEYETLFADLCVEEGYRYMGQTGSGHFVKMVHNGIEYGMMQAIAEGFSVLRQSDFDLDLVDVAHVYNHGSVIQSRLIGWLRQGYAHFGEALGDVSGKVGHSGEGLWTVETAEQMGIETPVIKDALRFREQSHQNPSYTGKVVSLLRYMFGGHDVSPRQ